MNTTKIEEFKIIVIKPGVYLKETIQGAGFTDDPSRASRFELNDFENASRMAKKYYGDVKKITVTTEVQDAN